MTQSELLEAADRIGRLITDARTSLTQDRDIDLGELEAGMSKLHRDVEAVRPRAPTDLAQRLHELLADLDALERALVARHSARHGTHAKA